MVEFELCEIAGLRMEPDFGISPVVISGVVRCRHSGKQIEYRVQFLDGPQNDDVDAYSCGPEHLLKEAADGS